MCDFFLTIFTLPRNAEFDVNTYNCSCVLIQIIAYSAEHLWYIGIPGFAVNFGVN